MFFFFHLLSGLILGLLVGDLLHDRRWVIPCAVGAVLPDLLDKPLGYIVFSSTLYYGRIWFHSLLMLGVVLLIGILVWKFHSNLIGIAVAAGMFVHQLLDFMWWQDPVTWFYPFLGPLAERSPSNFLWMILLKEITDPWEWMAFGVVAVCLFVFLKTDIIREEGRYPVALRVLLILALVALVPLSLVLFHLGY